MKKLLYLLLLLPLTLVGVSCDDDDNRIPDVSVKTTIEGGVFHDNTIYVVQGEVLKINVALENHTDKDGQMGVVTFFWDHYLAGQAVTVPYQFEVNTANQPVGTHLLQAEMPIYVVDYPICTGYFDYNVKIVPTADDMPEPPAAETLPGNIRAK